MSLTSRRAFLLAAGSAALSAAAGCSSSRSVTRRYVYRDAPIDREPVARPESHPDGALLYAEKLDEPYPLPAIPYQKIEPRLYRQMVDDPTGQAPGTLVVDTGNHHLYFTYPGGKAMRYGVGLGRAGFEWSGRGKIQYKRKWPRWVPPDEMIARQPELARFSAEAGGQPPGLDNPLGARALYIFQNGEDTLYRIHGSPEWWTIGKSVSSGCVRMINQDVCDLYDRVPDGTPILVTNLNRPDWEDPAQPETAYRRRERAPLGPDEEFPEEPLVDLEGPVDTVW
jgi:lipoprotein-anchoring transpeptidase ErfK/SrfK